MKKLLYGSSMILVLILGCGFYLAATSKGLGVLIGLINRVAGTEILAEVKSGSLLSGFELDKLNVSSKSSGISAKYLQLEWHLFEFLFTEKKINSLVLKDVIILQKTIDQPTEQPSSNINIPDLAINNLSISNLQIRNPDDTELAQIDEVQASLKVLNNTISFNDFLVRRQNIALNTNGSILMERPYVISIATDISYTNSSETRLEGRIVIEGELNQFTTTLEIPDGNATISVSDVATSPVWSANLSLSEFRPDQIDTSLPEVGINIDLDMSGTATSATSNSSINLDYPDVPANTTESDKQEILMIPDEFQLGFDARLDTDSQVISFNELSISSGDITLNSSGVYDFLREQFAITINWEEWLISMSEIEAPLVSSGSLSLNGELDSYNIDTDISLTGLDGFPSTSMTASGNGNLNSLVVDPLELELLDGMISAAVNISWVDSIEVGVDWVGEGLDPGVLWPQWGGSLKTSGNMLLGRVNETWVWTTEEVQVNGLLKDIPLTMMITGNSQVTGDIDLSARVNYANLDLDFSGTVGDEVDISWQVNSPDLSRVDNSLAGMLASTGQVTGTVDIPVINAEISASDINSPWGSSRAIAASITSGVNTDSKLNASIMVDGVIVDDLELESLQANLQGTRQSHEFSMNSKLQDLELNISGLGNFTDTDWRGQLQSLDAVHARFDSWSLEAMTEIEVSSTHFQTGPLCMQYASGSVCINGMYERETASWSFNAESIQVPLSLLQSQLPGAPEIAGQADIILHIEGQDTRPESGVMKVDITDSNITLKLADETQQSIPLSGSFIELQLQSGILNGMAEIPAINQNFKPITAHIEISGYEDFSVLPVDLPLSGGLVAGGNDLSLLSIISPELQSLEGSFDIDVNIAGTMQEPQILGKAEISDASYEFLDLGIGITDINLLGTNTPDYEYEINGKLKSGEGLLQAEAHVQQITEKGIELMARLTGENFEMVNLPELWAIVNPDIQSRLTLSDQYYDGNIMIPAAIIDLDEAVTAVVISDDEIIDGKKANEKKSMVNQHISVNISLGDEIEIRGMGISGKLVGSLILSNINTNNVLVADGEIEIINGNYSAYGQELTIAEGKLVYNKVSLENPIISIRATRNVVGVIVGIAVNGYLSSPVVTLFSSANLPQEEILSYIVFGRPLNSLTSGEGQDLIGAATSLGIRKSGLLTEKLASMFGLDQLNLSGSTAQNASIVVGKYINPRLYLSYGLGIVDRISTARLNYKLSNKFSLEAERGQETGVDVFYNLEK